ncbi:MAG: rhodanese-like domain-containing protein [Gemmatimonadaceae bacterium]
MSAKSADELLAEARARIREVSAADVVNALNGGSAPLLLDVREPRETNLGCIAGAQVIPLGDLEARVGAMISRDANVVIYCARGNRSALAADAMQRMGYTNVASMAGGWLAWMGLDGPVEG